MRWLSDNAVLVSFLVALVAVLAAIAYAALKGWALYRGSKRQVARVTPLTAGLQNRVAAAQAKADRIPRRQGDIQARLEHAKAHAAAVGVMASHASRAQRTLLAPLRYIGR